MSNDEPNAGQDATDLELELETTSGEKDPLDLLGEDELRAEAKKLRAINNRKPKVDTVVKKEEPAKVVVPTDDFIKKSDVARLAVSNAKDLVSDEVREHWDDLLNIPLSGYDNLDAKSIAQNMADRLVIYNARNPKVEKKEDVSDLSTTKATGTGSGPAEKKDKVKDPPNFSVSKKPDDWYK
jgi:hypothetical protein